MKIIFISLFIELALCISAKAQVGDTTGSSKFHIFIKDSVIYFSHKNYKEYNELHVLIKKSDTSDNEKYLLPGFYTLVPSSPVLYKENEIMKNCGAGFLTGLKFFIVDSSHNLLYYVQFEASDRIVRGSIYDLDTAQILFNDTLIKNIPPNHLEFTSSIEIKLYPLIDRWNYLKPGEYEFFLFYSWPYPFHGCIMSNKVKLIVK